MKFLNNLLVIKNQNPKMTIHQYARQLRKNSTEAEIILWKKLRARRFKGYKFRRQAVIQNRYIPDFFCCSQKLIIEVDGGIHKDPDVRIKDLSREKELHKLGYRIIRFTNSEVISDVMGVLRRIDNVLE